MTVQNVRGSHWQRVLTGLMNCHFVAGFYASLAFRASCGIHDLRRSSVSIYHAWAFGAAPFYPRCRGCRFVDFCRFADVGLGPPPGCICCSANTPVKVAAIPCAIPGPSGILCYPHNTVHNVSTRMEAVIIFQRRSQKRLGKNVE